jgi:hypothetical protein
MYRAGTWVWLGVILAGGGPTAASSLGAISDAVDLQLVLAVDVSLSMNETEQLVQRKGYVSAFKSSEVMKAIASGLLGRIAVTYIEWSGGGYQEVVVPWRAIGNNEDALLFADALERAPISRQVRTSISGALDFAAESFSTSGFESERRTIDISGDGPNNEGWPLPEIRDRVVGQGITINGLPLLFDPTHTIATPDTASLLDYYEDCVIGGPTAFVVPVFSLDDFARAIQRKLILEIVSVAPRVVPVVDKQMDRPRVDCVVVDSKRP